MRPTKSCLSLNLSKQVTCHISGHQHRKAGSLPRARNGSPWFYLTACGKCLFGKIQHTLGCCAQAPQQPAHFDHNVQSASQTNEFLGTLLACPCQRLPIRESPYQHLGTADKQVSWHIQSVHLPQAPNSGEPLAALFPNSGEPSHSMQSEETVAIRQHLQTTDSDNFDVHVEEYISQEHNDDQIS